MSDRPLPETITLAVGSHGRLIGDYVPGPVDPDFAVLWVHGFGSTRGGEKALAAREECACRGWSFAAFDFRGHGDSSGTMHELRASHLLEDLEVVRAWLSGHGRRRLGIIGSSMGAFASAWFASRHPQAIVGAVVLAPAFAMLDRFWGRLTPEEREEWRRTDRLRVKSEWVETEIAYGFVEEREFFRPAELAAAWQTPLLAFHGMGDDIVPVADSLSFLQQAPYPGIELRLLKSGDHRLLAFKDEIAGEAVRFFAKLVSSPS